GAQPDDSEKPAAECRRGDRMKPRQVVGGVLGIVAAAVAWAADPAPGVPRIGFLSTYEVGLQQSVQRRLQELGWVEGKSAAFEFRFAQGRTERLPELAAELVRAKVDVIVAMTNVPAFAARNATQTIPIVVYAAHDAVGTGLARTLARPGGNITGTESLAPELDAKRIELIKQIVPSLRDLAVLYNPNDQGSPIHLKWAQTAGQALGFAISRLEVRGGADYEPTLAGAAARRPDALLTLTDNITYVNWPRVADFALKQRVPTVCEFSGLVEAGCLVSYGPALDEFTERVAHQVDRILKGAKPADLPFEQPTRFELVVNLRTARAIGVAIPQAILVRADRVLE
ncbi:MAG TPA: ABC transporter substrate-binding protein, partial [Burkholderiaceae bacterium]|nr:ABC transporter substrate-binding protein [Burkholderiaceae bacterium]